MDKATADKTCPNCGREMSWGSNTGWVCVVCPFPALTQPPVVEAKPQGEVKDGR